MTHTFPFDPGSILGVPSGASLREIRDAYHQKSLKHHPDKGGDEWAFRLVAQAYEILSTARVMTRANEDDNRHRPVPEPSTHSHFHFHPARFEQARARPRRRPQELGRGRAIAPGGFARGRGKDRQRRVAHPPVRARLLARLLRHQPRRPQPELLAPCGLARRRVRRESGNPSDAARTLKKIGEAFKTKGVRKHAVKSQASVEHGRFEGWLTYPTAVLASEALDAFRDALHEAGLVVEKQIREMTIPRPGG